MTGVGRRLVDALTWTPQREGAVRRLAAHVVGDRPLVVFDVGAAGGLIPQLRAVSGYLDAVGFDANAAECERLNSRARAAGVRQRFLPYALAGSEEPRTLHVARKPETSSFLEPYRPYHARFHDPERMATVETAELRPTTLTKVIAELGKRPEFLKLDVQGLEGEILRSLGGEDRADLLAVHIELLFGQFYVGQPAAGAIHDFLAEQGFELYELLRFGARRAAFDVDAYATRGQLAHVDALYLRRPEALGPESSRRLAVLAACFEHFDVAHELLRAEGDAEGAALVLEAGRRPAAARLVGRKLVQLGRLGERMLRSPADYWGDDYRPEQT